MKNKDLIKKLQAFDPDMDVLILDHKMDDGTTNPSRDIASVKLDDIVDEETGEPEYKVVTIEIT